MANARFAVDIIDDRKAWDNLVKKVRELSDPKGNLVEVGLFNDVGLISIARENEFGDPPRRARPYPIPERSFLRFVFDKNLDANTKVLFRGLANILLGKQKRFKVLEDIGKKVQKDIRKFMLSGYYRSNNPNHPITIRRKGHDQPLIQTGKIYQTLTYKVGRGMPKASSKTTIVEK